MGDSWADQQAKDNLYDISQAQVTQNYWSSSIVTAQANSNGCMGSQRKQTHRRSKRIETELVSRHLTELPTISTPDHRALKIRQLPESNLLVQEPSRVSSTQLKIGKIIRTEAAKKVLRPPSTEKLTLPSLSHNRHERVLRYKLLQCSQSAGKSAKKHLRHTPSNHYSNIRKYPSAFREYSNSEYTKHLDQTPTFLRF